MGLFIIRRTSWGGGGRLGCTYNGRPCRVSRADRLEEARVHTTDWSSLMAARPRLTGALLQSVKFARAWADGYGYLLVATGRADAMLDPHLNPWDVAPLIPVITEAGGRFPEWTCCWMKQGCPTMGSRATG